MQAITATFIQQNQPLKWSNPLRSLQPRLSSLSPCKSKRVSCTLSSSTPAQATTTPWLSSNHPPGVGFISRNAATLLEGQPSSLHVNCPAFLSWWVKRGACQKSDSPNPSQTAADGMNHLLELSLPSHWIQRSRSLSLTQLTGGEIKPILRNLDSPDQGQHPNLCYIITETGIMEHCRTMWDLSFSVWAWRINAINNGWLRFSADAIARLFLHWIANYSTESNAALHLVLIGFCRSPHWLEEGIESVH